MPKYTFNGKTFTKEQVEKAAKEGGYPSLGAYLNKYKFGYIPDQPVVNNQTSVVNTSGQENKLEEIVQLFYTQYSKANVLHGADFNTFILVLDLDKLKNLYQVGVELNLPFTKYTSYNEFNSFMTLYINRYKKTSYLEIYNSQWKELYSSAVSNGYTQNLEMYKLFVLKNEDEYCKIYNRSNDGKGKVISKEQYKKIIFPKASSYYTSYIKIGTFQERSSSAASYTIVLFLVVLCLYKFKNRIFEFCMIKINLLSGKFLQLWNKQDIEKYAQIGLIVWTFFNFYLLLTGLIAYSQNDREAFWFFNNDYVNKYDLSEFFLLVGLPLLFYFLYLKYFRNEN